MLRLLTDKIEIHSVNEGESSFQKKVAQHIKNIAETDVLPICLKFHQRVLSNVPISSVTNQIKSLYTPAAIEELSKMLEIHFLQALYGPGCDSNIAELPVCKKAKRTLNRLYNRDHSDSE